MPIVERDEEGANHCHRESTGSLPPTIQYCLFVFDNTTQQKLPEQHAGGKPSNRAHTAVEQRGIMQVKVTSHKGSDTANDSPLEVPDELGQETLRVTAEALFMARQPARQLRIT